MTDDQTIDDKTKLFNRLDKIDKDMEEVKTFITMFSEMVKSEEKKPKEQTVSKEPKEPKKKSFLDEIFEPYN